MATPQPIAQSTDQHLGSKTTCLAVSSKGSRSKNLLQWILLWLRASIKSSPEPQSKASSGATSTNKSPPKNERQSEVTPSAIRKMSTRSHSISHSIKSLHLHDGAYLGKSLRARGEATAGGPHNEIAPPKCLTGRAES
eukprot:3766863-Amphidinium_carterae.1